MRIFPARRWLGLLLCIILLTIFLSQSGISFLKLELTPQVYAAGINVGVTGTPTSSDAIWKFDPEVTEVGKNSERARQFLWWTLSHPAIYTTPVLAQLWSITRNIVYVFVILVVVTMGLGLILSSRKGKLGPIFSGISSPVAGLNLPSVFIKIAMILLYVTFSYVFIIALIQFSEISMKFFIEFIGGKDLFNVIFAGSGNIEQNYISFMGFSDTNPISHEMVNTSLFLIRLTSLTYFTMALIVILRSVILWFLLVISPFLALLMPFVFIRNVGWIWIGVFFQWLFYGPLMALFLMAISKIWIFGIPYPFDFSRVNKASGQVYRTAINILYGGPAQTISPGNTANYVDTYAEYVIALVMLWTSIILPWLLLRIFRDYCCAGIAAVGSTINAIFDRLRQYPPPPPSIQPVNVPVSVSGIALELPFRQKIKEETEVTKKITLENIREITHETTHEITRKMDMSVSSLADVSRFEMDKMKQATVRDMFNKISSPFTASTSVEKERYASLHNELQKRATSGDILAKSLLTASENKVESLVAGIPVGTGKPMVATPSKTAGVYAPKMPQVIPSSLLPGILSSQTAISNISKQSNLSETKVREVLSAIPSLGVSVSLTSLQAISKLAMKTGVSEDKVREVLERTQTAMTIAMKEVAVPHATVPVLMAGNMVQTQVSVEDYEDVKKMWLKHYREAPIPTTEEIKTREQWLNKEIQRLTNISNMLASTDTKMRKKGLEEVAEILPFLLLGGFSDAETLSYLQAKLEAAKQINTELAIQEKAKEETKMEIKEEEETLVEVTAKKQEKQKAQTLTQEKEIPVSEKSESTKDNETKQPQKINEDLKQDSK